MQAGTAVHEAFELAELGEPIEIPVTSAEVITIGAPDDVVHRSVASPLTPRPDSDPLVHSLSRRRASSNTQN